MKNITRQKVYKQKGFTLIELVVVIVILGILAVTAAPKFINLQDDARTATLQAVKASMQSAAAMVYSKSLLAGNESSAGGATVVVDINGTDVEVRYGYPRDATTVSLSNWQNDLLDISSNDFTVERQNNGIVIYPVDVPLSGRWPANILDPQTGERNCYVYYRESDVSGDGPLELEVAPCL